MNEYIYVAIKLGYITLAIFMVYYTHNEWWVLVAVLPVRFSKGNTGIGVG